MESSHLNLAIRKLSDEVFVADDPIVRIGGEHLAFLKQQAAKSARRRARICAHRQPDDAVHEMVIVLCADSYVHPHKHMKKTESFHIIEGRLDVAVFDDYGAVVDVIELGDPSTGKPFFYRLADSLFHTLLIQSEFLVMHEVTNGPFIENEALLAPFAPPEGRCDESFAYMQRLMRGSAARPFKESRL